MKGAIKEKIKQELIQAMTRIVSENISDMIPDEGLELGYAIPGAMTPDDVGTCILLPDTKDMKADPEEIRFGIESPIVSCILTALRFSPELRCACTVRYSDALRDISEDMILETCTCGGDTIPPGIPTMDWAVAFCSQQESGVPDMLFIKNRDSGMIEARMFGEMPGEIATNLIKISQRIIDATN